MILSQVQKARLATNALFFINGLCFASWASRIPDIKERLQLGDAALGTILFSAPIGSLVALPLAGIIIHKYGSRSIAFFASLFYLIAMPCIGFASSPLALVAALFVFGFGGDLLNISMNVQAVNVENALNRSIMSSFHAVFSIGFMLGAAVGGALSAGQITAQAHLSGMGLITFLVGIITYQFLFKKDHQSGTDQPLFALPDKSLFLLSIICFCGMLCEGAMADWSVLYYKQMLHNPNGFVTAGFTAFSVAMVLGRLFGDKLVLKFGLRKTLIINCLLLVLGMTTALALPIAWLVVLGFGIAGLGLSTIVPLIYSQAGHSKTMSAGVALAAISTVGIGGFLIGPVIIGYISEFTSLRSALALLIGLGLLGTLLSWRIKTS